jgi:hypothetical protein
MPKRDTVAEVRFSGPVGKRPKGRFLAQAKLPGDAPGNAYGQWDLVVEPVGESDVEQPDAIIAFVGFLSPEAPADALKTGTRIELFNGPKPIGTALIHVSLSAPRDDSARVDSDFLARTEAA